MKKIYSVAIAIAVLLVVFAYGFNAENMSETTMVNASFVLIPLAVFGISGLLTMKQTKPLLRAIGWAGVSFLTLVVFFSVVWPWL